MPAHIHTFPVSATNIMLKDSKGETYPITLDTDTFNRTGEDGDIPVLPLNGGDEFSTDILSGSWHKGWDSDIDTFTASIDSGILRLTGVAKVAGTGSFGWINNHHPLPLIDELELTVSMESPVDDTGATADRDIRTYFILRGDNAEDDPVNDADNQLRMAINVDETGLLLQIQKRIGGASASTLASGYDYTMDTNRGTGDLEATIWRLVFNGKPGTTGATMSVYLKQSDTLANAESATEHEVTGSPFDVSDLAFNIAYPSYEIYTQNTTYFGTAYDSANRAASGYLRVTYPPQFKTCYDFTPSDYGKGDVCLFDGDPDSDGVRVYDKDHTFTNNEIYLQNGLIRFKLDEMAQYSSRTYGYTDSAWVEANSFRPQLVDSSKFLDYHKLLSIEVLSPEKIKLKIRVHDTATEDTDYYMDYYITVYRGGYVFEIEPITVYPIQEYKLFVDCGFSGGDYGYAGNNKISDNMLNISATNSIMSDNYMIIFNTADKQLMAVAINEKPDDYFYIHDGKYFRPENSQTSQLGSLKYWIIIVPFANVANLFKEAEDATISASARLYLDGAGEDTVTENDGVWANTTNCAVIENQAGGEESVGSFCVRITSSAGGAVVATCTPVTPLGKLTKFDFLKLYLHGTPDSDVTIRLKDSSGGDVSKTQAVTGSATQYTLDLPHSATDLQGWADNSFDFADFTTLTIEWTASGAGEIVYVDGLHFYIGTTTTRGRGETLSGGEAVVLDAEGEYVLNDYSPFNELPVGRYLSVYRAKDTDQLADVLRERVFNSTLSKFRNQSNEDDFQTLTGSFAHYIQAFDVTSEDSGDAFRTHWLRYNESGEDTIFVDYFLIMPISDGMNLPLDLAHNPLRSITQHPRLCIR